MQDREPIELKEILETIGEDEQKAITELCHLLQDIGSEADENTAARLQAVANVVSQWQELPPSTITKLLQDFQHPPNFPPVLE